MKKAIVTLDEVVALAFAFVAFVVALVSLGFAIGALVVLVAFLNAVN